jgi:hypothetical protein
MNITIESRTPLPEDINDRFPLHFDSGYIGETGGWDTLHRVEQDGTHYQISKRYGYGPNADTEYKFEKAKVNIQKELVGLLDSSSPATEAEFMTLLAQVREELATWFYPEPTP